MVVTEPAAERRVQRRRHSDWASMLPTLIFAWLIYNALALLGIDFDAARFAVPMPSGASWSVSAGDMLLTFTLILLFIEILKSTRTGGHSVVDHALSMIVFVVCLIEFLIWPPAAKSLFFLITWTTLIDVIAGFSVTIRAARRDYSFGGES